MSSEFTWAKTKRSFVIHLLLSGKIYKGNYASIQMQLNTNGVVAGGEGNKLNEIMMNLMKARNRDVYCLQVTEQVAEGYKFRKTVN